MLLQLHTPRAQGLLCTRGISGFDKVSNSSIGMEGISSFGNAGSSGFGRASSSGFGVSRNPSLGRVEISGKILVGGLEKCLLVRLLNNHSPNLI
ncbi:MAG: hypothetical protein Q8887_02520 [Candidatus Phytoplasma australasiaticum]|nr:hypothetical protein [Candidatus Phytoplasma australasiaticum]